MATDFKSDIIKRHEKAHNALLLVASRYVKRKGNTFVFKEIGRSVGCSHITVSNYINGDYNDGFMTETLTKAFKYYNSKNK